jgi:citrate synthase
MVDQRRFDNQPRWLDARAAAKHLGIDLRTLYAYVSRGRVHSVPAERGRKRLYALEDLDRLKVRRDARAGHGAVAAGALRWGEPVLDSAITAITLDGPAYRGRLATELAQAGIAFENVAELLWSGYLPSGTLTWPRPAIQFGQLGRLVPAAATPLEVMSLLVPLAGLDDRSRTDGRPDAIVMRARQLLPMLAAALAPGFAPATVTRALGAGSVAAIAARALGADDDDAAHLDHALVLLADHELNNSSFTARVVASTDADLYACVTAALASLSGPRHGTASERFAKFADEIGDPESARAAIRALRKKGDVPPGFGHPLYPGGDPRAAPLLAAARDSSNKRARTMLAIVDAARDAQPSVDIGLAALVASLGAPPTAASGLFAVARAAGWIAHVIEQRAAGVLLRPRARYVGP